MAGAGEYTEIFNFDQTSVVFCPTNQQNACPPFGLQARTAAGVPQLQSRVATSNRAIRKQARKEKQKIFNREFAKFKSWKEEQQAAAAAAAPPADAEMEEQH